MIPMVDLKAQYASLKDEIERDLRAALENCAFVLGPNVQSFEQEAAAYLGVKHAIGVASGTDALHLALRAAGVKAGDEVITTPFTFIATAEAIRYIGAHPVFVDIDPRTFNIDPNAVEAAITVKTAAVLPVHLFGQPADMPTLQALCDRYGLRLIEDCAQSFGARIRDSQTGTMGISAGFSFFPSKNLGGYGDGGLVTTNADEIAAAVRSYRNHGSEVRYFHDVVGYNSRLDELQAVILRIKLRHLDEFNRQRRRVAHRYTGLLADLPLQTPHEDGIGTHVYHQYTLLSEQREEIMTALQQEGVASAIYYPVPLHRQKAFAEDCADVHLPITESVTARCLSLPIYPELADESIVRIAEVIRRAMNA